MPIDCTIGQDCVIQNYVDRDPGKGAEDFRCGHLTYDGHRGTDFRIRNLSLMRRGVTVKAAAPGRVLGIRNDMPDIDFRKVRLAEVKGRECGNGVRIDIGDGWVTQYCHMRRGSVRVRAGDRVDAGEPLGLVGESGRAAFPHLHFQLEYNREPVDPFVGLSPKLGCSVKERPLWKDARKNGLSYQPVGLIDAGFLGRPPVMDVIELGLAPHAALSRNSAALVFWVKLFGVRPEDRQSMTIRDPDGDTIVKVRPKPVNRPKAQWLTFAGKRPPRDGESGFLPWPKTGEYRGVYTLTRKGKTLVRVERSVRIE